MPLMFYGILAGVLGLLTFIPADPFEPLFTNYISPLFSYNHVVTTVLYDFVPIPAMITIAGIFLTLIPITIVIRAFLKWANVE